MDWKKLATSAITNPAVQEAALRVADEVVRLRAPGEPGADAPPGLDAPARPSLAIALRDAVKSVAADAVAKKAAEWMPGHEDDAMATWVETLHRGELLVPYAALRGAIEATTPEELHIEGVRRDGALLVVDARARRAGADLRVDVRVEPRGVAIGERIEIGLRVTDATLSGDGVYDRVVAAVAATICQFAWGGVAGAVDRTLITACSLRKEGDVVWVDVTSAPAPARALSLVKAATGLAPNFGALMTCSEARVTDDGVVLTLSAGAVGEVVLAGAAKLRALRAR